MPMLISVAHKGLPNEFSDVPKEQVIPFYY